MPVRELFVLPLIAAFCEICGSVTSRAVSLACCVAWATCAGMFWPCTYLFALSMSDCVLLVALGL
jgi:hypothetical protein